MRRPHLTAAAFEMPRLGPSVLDGSHDKSFGTLTKDRSFIELPFHDCWLSCLSSDQLS